MLGVSVDESAAVVSGGACGGATDLAPVDCVSRTGPCGGAVGPDPVSTAA